MSKSKLVKKLTMTLFTLVAVFAVGLTNVNAKTVTVENEEELINASKGIDSEINEIKLAKDITLTKYLNFYVVNDITLDLNGQTLDTGSEGVSFNYGQSDYDESNSKYYYNFNSKLTIKDSGSSKTGKILTKKSINFTTYDVTHDEEIKGYGLTIDGGYYEIISSTTTFISLFTNDYYTNGRNITVDVKVKDAVFNIGDQKSLFGTSSDSDSDIKFNFNFESLKAMGLASKLGSNKLGKKKIDNVIDPNSKAYFQELPYTTGAAVLTEADRNTLVDDFYSTGGNDPYIIIKKVNGFEINNVAINETYKETPSLNSISIKNISGSDLQIKNVTVDSANFTIEGPSTLPTVSAGATNTDYKIKAKEGLPAGTYTATITVTDGNGNYTATVTLVVKKKQLDGLGAGFTSSWTYGETALEPNISGVDSLGADEYKVEYAKAGTNVWSTIKPTTAGDYTIRLTITGSNYKTGTASSTFKILPTEKEVKIVANSSSHQYDGNAYTDNGYKIYFDGTEVTDGKLLYDDIIGNVKINGSVTDVADNTTVENNLIDRYSYTITNKESYKNIKLVDGNIKITPITASIVVKADSDTRVYDGTELTKNTYTYTDGVLLSGDKLEATITGSQKYVGSYNNVVSNVKVIRDGKDITSNYTMGTHVNGTLTVNVATQTFIVNENVNVLVNGSLTIDEIKAQLGSTIANYNIEYVSGDAGAGTFDSTTGFTAGATSGQVKMKAVAPAIDENHDGTNEYAEATQTFYINVVNKENVTISGLEDNQVFTFDNTTKTPWGTGTITVEGNKVDVNDLEIFYKGTGSTSYDSKFAPVDAGTYTITYKVKDSNPNYVGSVTYRFTIKKAQLNKPTASTTSFVYDGTSKGYSSFHDSETFVFTGTNKATNVGNYSLTISLKDKNNYEWKDDGTTTDVVINWSITQATPDYTVPTGLTGVKGNFLSSIELPYGFTWNNASELLTAGTHTYKATYTPEDTTNYKVIDNIDITVVVKNKFVLSGIVNGGNGTISVSSLEVLEGDKAEVVFTPDEGYMIDKVLVEGTEVEVTGNKLELTMDGNKLVTVSYKKIPFTVTVKEVTGATITPNGAVTVSYGEDKEFSITANSGYKLVKVLVDGTDKTADMVGDTLKLTNITSNINLEVVVEKIVYEVTEGANQKYTITKNEEAKFRINADFRLFDDGKVYVDNELVDSKNYTAESGSTIITLKKEFVDTLSVGEHTLKVLFNDGGVAITTFNVAKVTVPTDNPQTGDNIGFYIISGILSIVGLVGTGIFYRRKQTN